MTDYKIDLSDEELISMEYSENDYEESTSEENTSFEANDSEYTSSTYEESNTISQFSNETFRKHRYKEFTEKERQEFYQNKLFKYKEPPLNIIETYTRLNKAFQHDPLIELQESFMYNRYTSIWMDNKKEEDIYDELQSYDKVNKINLSEINPFAILDFSYFLIPDKPGLLNYIPIKIVQDSYENSTPVDFEG